MNKSYKGIRECIDCYNQKSYCIILIIWDDQTEIYNISTYDNVYSKDISGLTLDILGQWSFDLGSAKRKALIDTGFKSSDFTWEEI